MEVPIDVQIMFKLESITRRNNFKQFQSGVN